MTLTNPVPNPTNPNVCRQGDEGPGYYTSAVAEPPPEAVD